MGIQRTAKTKSTNQSTKVIEYTYSLPKSVSRSGATKSLLSATQAKASKQAPQANDPSALLFGYPASFIYRDIMKTLVVTGITVTILIILVLRGHFL